MTTRAGALVRIDLGDAAAVSVAQRSLAPENGQVLSTRVEGTALVLVAKPAPLGSLVVTLEDAFSCVVGAAGALRAAGDR